MESWSMTKTVKFYDDEASKIVNFMSVRNFSYVNNQFPPEFFQIFYIAELFMVNTLSYYSA